MRVRKAELLKNNPGIDSKNQEEIDIIALNGDKKSVMFGESI